MDINSWEWPQWTYVILNLVGLLWAAHSHNKPKKGNENFWSTIISSLLIWSLLYFGGFFN